jgi:hypothetical protein
VNAEPGFSRLWPLNESSPKPRREEPQCFRIAQGPGSLDEDQLTEFAVCFTACSEVEFDS